MKIVVLTSALLALASGLAPLHRARPHDKVQGSYIVKFKDSYNQDDVMPKVIGSMRRKGHNVAVTKVYRHVMAGIAAHASENAIQKLREREEVESVYEDTIVRIAQGRQEAQHGANWGLDRIDQRMGFMAFDGVYNPRGEAPHTVYAYVLDTGVTPTHVDFDGRVTAWYDAITKNNQDYGLDCHGHGTHTSGILGSHTYGVAKDVLIRGLRVIDCWGKGRSSTVIDGIDHIIANGTLPGVVSMSLMSSINFALDEAVKKLITLGYVVSVAAGNGNHDACSYSPSRVQNVITVAASSLVDKRYEESNYGSCVDIFAPGQYIKSTWADSDTSTEVKSGTSMSCPFVSGAAALLLGQDPTLSPAAVKSKILSMASPDKVSDAGEGTPNLMLYVNLSL